jgi:hypothetical protein
MFDREYLKQHNNIVFKDRELIIEKEQNGENTMLRFKIGDGVKPYGLLQYVSSLYALFPNICLCDNEYKSCLTISFDSNSGNENMNK